MKEAKPFKHWSVIFKVTCILTSQVIGLSYSDLSWNFSTLSPEEWVEGHNSSNWGWQIKPSSISSTTLKSTKLASLAVSHYRREWNLWRRVGGCETKPWKRIAAWDSFLWGNYEVKSEQAWWNSNSSKGSWWKEHMHNKKILLEHLEGCGISSLMAALTSLASALLESPDAVGFPIDRFAITDLKRVWRITFLPFLKRVGSTDCRDVPSIGTSRKDRQLRVLRKQKIAPFCNRGTDSSLAPHHKQSSHLSKHKIKFSKRSYIWIRNLDVSVARYAEERDEIIRYYTYYSLSL